MRPCFCTIPWIMRAIWSAPPPVLAGTMNSTVLVGFHSAYASLAPTRPKARLPATSAAEIINGLSGMRDIGFPPRGCAGHDLSFAGFFRLRRRFPPATRCETAALVFIIRYYRSEHNDRTGDGRKAGDQG